jgi:hypothetical protein
MGDYQQGQNGSSGSSGSLIFTVLYVLIALVVIYYAYQYMYSTDVSTTTLISGQIDGSITAGNIPPIPTPYEGGEYTVTTWVYVNSFNKNRNTKKHIFELQGQYFSTLLIGLGAFNNTLMVRTHTQDPMNNVKGAGTGTGTGTGSPLSPVPPNAASEPGNLSAATMAALFKPMAMDDSLLTVQPVCDLPEIDLQRWTMVTVVLTGRTIDVYLDGKLSRSCTSSTFFKVDPTGVKPVIADRGGFDGYIGNTKVANHAMNPDEIYRAYLSGPTGSGSMDPLGWFISLFKGST